VSRSGDIDGLPVRRLWIDSLLPADTPRLRGVDEAHVLVLVESAKLPPILVHATTWRVIDGMHRVRAALLRGEDQIDARLFDGTERDAFATAVRSNVHHGFPLTLADRTAAAARLIAWYPDWSDRAIAGCAGLADKTVAAIRRRSALAMSPTRQGLDGRRRPVNTADRRLAASRLIGENPDASLRKIATAAGIAPSTVLDVRNRVLAGQHPVPDRLLTHTEPAGDPTDQFQALAEALRTARLDPSLRLNAAGRLLLRWLSAYPAGSVEWDQVVGSVPSHCVPLVVELARRHGDLLHEFARQVDERQGRSTA
jgi:ParB-like nuclease family protein